MNDTEREQWVLNDESLYNFYRSKPCHPMRKFLREYRSDIDAYIERALS